jgi:hypothetical protein
LPDTSKPGAVVDVPTALPHGTAALVTSPASGDKASAVPVDVDTPHSVQVDTSSLAQEKEPETLPKVVESPESPAGVSEHAQISAPGSSRHPPDPMAMTPSPADKPGSIPPHSFELESETAAMPGLATASEPGGLSSEERSAVQVPRASPAQAIGTEPSAPETGYEDLPCDPDRRFVFTHPSVPGVLELVDCLPGGSGAGPLNALPLTNRLVLLVQYHLNDLGYVAGPTDGIIGPRTRDAIRRFQLNEGRRATGVIDYNLLRDLQRVRSASFRR